MLSDLFGKKKQKYKKRIKGIVDRVESGVVVVVIKHPSEKDMTKEIYVPLTNFKRRTPKEGDYVCVQIENMDTDGNLIEPEQQQAEDKPQAKPKPTKTPKLPKLATSKPVTAPKPEKPKISPSKADKAKKKKEKDEKKEKLALEKGFADEPNLKQIIAIVDRIANNIVVVVIRHPENQDMVKEIYIPRERFKVLPKECDPIPIDPETEDVITPNIGDTMLCEIKFLVTGSDNEFITFTYGENCPLSGLYNNPADKANILRARKKFWKEAKKDEAALEKKRPNHIVYISKTTYWTDKQPNKKLMTSYVRYVAYEGPYNNKQFESLSINSNRVPNDF